MTRWQKGEKIIRHDGGTCKQCRLLEVYGVQTCVMCICMCVCTTRKMALITILSDFEPQHALTLIFNLLQEMANGVRGALPVYATF